MEDNYWIRLRNVMTFLIVWIGPGIIGDAAMGYREAYALMLLTWVPAMLITEYLDNGT